ncbi:MAG: hypothetical protein JXA21_25320 [Anaerolineae bacterium]|nr:hypothetical protein [Anaerolineae bacterium]
MVEKKPAKSGKAIGTDPFADIEAEIWKEIGVAPGTADAETASPGNTPSEKAAPIIEIRDEADMALVAWLYQEESSPDNATTPPDDGDARDRP